MIMVSRSANAHAVLAVLFAGAFVMGSAEMLVVGMLDLIARDLSVSVSEAGLLVTANALGIAGGGPLLAMITTRFDRRSVLLGTLVMFGLLNLIPILGAGLPVLFGARIVIGGVQGLFIAAAFVSATSVVPPARTGRAMAVVISGFATASALGVPLGSLLGRAIGWRGSFGAVVAAAIVTLVVAWQVLPSVSTQGLPHAAGQARFAFAPRVLAVLLVAILMMAGLQSALTYLVPFLDRVTGVSGQLVSLFLLAYGASTAVGSYAGGRFADLQPSRSLIAGTAGVVVSLLALLAFGGSAIAVALAVFALGLFGMGAAPSIQHRVVSLAGPGGPLASSLPASAVNVGIACGSLAGGEAIHRGGVQSAIIVGAVIAAIGVIAACLTGSLAPVRADPTPATVDRG